MGRLGTICCNSSLERKISTSTGQAETYALASLVKDVVWTRHLADDMRRPQTNATELDTDNQGVHIQSTKAINHATAKHFRVSQAFIRGKEEELMIIILIFSRRRYVLNCSANIAMW